MVRVSKKVTPAVRDTVIEKTIEVIRSQYAYPEQGTRIADAIQEKMASGRYSDLTTVSDFCSALDDDLYKVSQDRHLGVLYSPEEAARLRGLPPGDEDPDGWFAQFRIDNFGLVRAEYMSGNVGYLRIDVFAPLSLAKNAAISMMECISNCDALIIDVRNNGGGDPYLVQLIESFFFEGKPKLLLTFYKRKSDGPEQIYTIPHLPGKRLDTVPLYILTSRRTFSGAEDFSYTLKHHGRALVVGEPTGGGANTIDDKVLHDDFVIYIPSGYPTHPKTGKNWEGIGVEPDIAVASEKALGVAHVHALQTLIEKSSDEERVRRLNFELERVRAAYSRVDVPREKLSKYVGTYGEYYVDLRDSALTVLSRKDDRICWRLVAISETLFAVENDEYNVRFDVDASGRAISLAFVHWKQDRENAIGRTDG